MARSKRFKGSGSYTYFLISLHFPIFLTYITSANVELSLTFLVLGLGFSYHVFGLGHKCFVFILKFLVSFPPCFNFLSTGHGVFDYLLGSFFLSYL